MACAFFLLLIVTTVIYFSVNRNSYPEDSERTKVISAVIGPGKEITESNLKIYPDDSLEISLLIKESADIPGFDLNTFALDNGLEIQQYTDKYIDIYMCRVNDKTTAEQTPYLFAFYEDALIFYQDLLTAENEILVLNAVLDYYGQTVDDRFILAGNFLKDNSDLLANAIQTLTNPDLKQDKVIAKVGSLPLTEDEFLYLKGLNQAMGEPNRDDNAIFNALIEEKMLLHYAQKENILPAPEDVDSYITAQKALYDTAPEARRIVDTLCAASGFSLDEYWNTYHYYIAYRFTLSQNVYHNLRNRLDIAHKYYLKVKDPDLYFISDQEYLDYCDQFKLNLKGKIKIVVTPSYKSQGFHADRKKLYLP